MALRVNTNVAALASQKNLGVSTVNMERSLRKLSSGLRISKAADDAAGLSIANRLRAQLRGYTQATQNAAQGAALAQVAEGAATEVSNILARLRELAVSSASGQQDSTSRASLNSEAQALVSEVTRIADNTKYGSEVLLGGSFGVAFSAGGSTIDSATGVASVAVRGAASGATFTVNINENANASTMYIYSNGVGAGQTVTFSTPASGQNEALNFDKLGIVVTVNSSLVDSSNNTLVTTSASDPSFQVGVDATDTDISLTLSDLSADGLSINSIDLSTASGAESAMTSIDTAINTVNTALGNIGAFQNRMDFAAANLASVFENVSAAESTIRDADIAKETTDFTRNQILVQAGVAVLAQANIVSQSALALLQ